MGTLLNRDDYLEDGLRQYHGHERFLQDARSNLFYHGWDHLAQNHMSGVFWARGNSWAAYTMARALKEIPVTHPSYMQIHDSLRDQLASLVRLQSEEGLWHTVLNNPESYREASGSAGIAAALIEFDEAIGSPLYRSYIHKSLEGLLKQVSEDGTLLNVSAGTAVMDDEEGYRNVSRRRIQGWGQGLGLAFFAAVMMSEVRPS
ncbi:rhamnogalacturonyl hydrolase YesR [Cohnella thailandensis]|nr:rhamnogalacturonyl hydrolase YesR [Cohnella thailandensis]